MNIETAFKVYGKEKMVKFLSWEITPRINEDMSINMILYTLDAHKLMADAEKIFNNLLKDPHGQLYLGNKYGIWKK
jgi:hypothetical protein